MTNRTYRGNRNSFAEYKSLHRWLRKTKPFPFNGCEKCASKGKLQVCNISGKYLWDTEDYFWGCTSCNHKASINKLHRFSEALKEHHNSPCQKEYQRGYSSSGRRDEYFEHNKERIRKYQKKYRSNPEHKSKAKEYHHKWHKDRIAFLKARTKQ